MEMLDGSRQLINEWEARDMDGEGCFWEGGGGGGEAGLDGRDASIQLLRKKVSRFRGMARCLAATLLLLIAGVVVVLLVKVQGRTQQAPDSQTKMQPNDSSPAVNINPQTSRLEGKKVNPSAMLTAPENSTTDGKYLLWKNDSGNAYCRGGFRYTNGDLVVPRSGIYRVFLQITYESGDEVCPPPDVKLKNQMLFISDNYNRDVTLLTSVDTVRCDEEQWSKSLYTSGSFSLNAGGRLHVKSNNRKLIAKNEHQVFFGAELVSY